MLPIRPPCTLQSRRTGRAVALAGLLLLASCAATSRGMAGLNARGVARLYWQGSNGRGLDAHVASTGLPTLLLTVFDVQSIKAVDLQLVIVPCDGGNISPAWEGNGSGGCNDAAWQFLGGGPGTYYPSLISGVPSLAVSHNEETVGAGGCGLASHGATLWYSAAGSAAARRDTTLEYCAWSAALDLRGLANGQAHSCTGDLGDLNGAQTVLITACSHYPCGESHGASVAVVDANGAIDYLPLASAPLVWGTTNCVLPQGFDPCTGSSAVRAASWGALRRLYE